MPMDKPSTEAAFSLLDPDGKPVAGTFTWNDDATELGFKPSELLKFGAAYAANGRDQRKGRQRRRAACAGQRRSPSRR